MLYPRVDLDRWTAPRISTTPDLHPQMAQSSSWELIGARAHGLLLK